ncbi:MAG TPA: serine/threonine-protein kinase [Candidatus Obscuribacterales bacterium]
MATNVNSQRTHCTTCGAKYEGTAKYCGVDGTALAPEPVEEDQEDTQRTAAKLQCGQCNALYPAHAKFCPIDGSVLVNHQDRSSTQHVVFRKEEDEVIGKTFAGKYKIEDLLGEGGMAKVYRAVHLEIEKPVVIKLMRQQIPTKDKDTSLKRFLQEIKVSAKLNHPNLVSVFDGGEIEGRPFLVMEYIQGDSLRHYINLNGTATFSDSINIIAQVCAGLEEAHEGGIIHRDLKPENIMLRDDSDRPDWVKVVDFGIAHLKQGGSKLTATGIAIGTVDYMSPEYLADKPIDQRADVYSVGIILHELLTGHCPFESKSAEAVMMKHLYTKPAPPSAARGDMKEGCALDKIVARALEKDPAQRYQTANEMRKDLQKAVINPNGA